MDGPVPGRPASPCRPWSRCRICRGRQSRAGLRRRASRQRSRLCKRPGLKRQSLQATPGMAAQKYILTAEGIYKNSASQRGVSEKRPEIAGAEPVSAALRKPGMTPSIKGRGIYAGRHHGRALSMGQEKRKRLRQTCGQQRLPADKKPSIFHASNGLRDAVKDPQGITMCKLHSNHLCCVHTDYLVSIKFYLENVKKDN